MIQEEFLQLEYSRIIVRWIKQYYKQYSQSPSAHIKDIYITEKSTIRDETMQELVGNFLASISQKYEEQDEFNVQYYIDKAQEYFEERSLLVTAETVQANILAGNKDKAKETMANYRQISRKLSRWVNPLDPEYAASVYDTKYSDEKDEDKADFLMKFPGQVGEFLGALERGWLVAFMGPLKRGKTQWLWETTVQLAMNRRNVAFISLEMPDKGVSARGYKRFVARTTESGDFLYPIFDCESNQDNTCRKSARTCRMGLLRPDGVKPDFNSRIAYTPCSVCMYSDPRAYRKATWFESVYRDRLNKKTLKEAVQAFEFQYGDRIRVISYPRFSANLSRIERDLDDLEATEDFVADALVLDYANILAPENGYSGGDEQFLIDTTWKSLGKLTGTRRVLLVTGVHSVRDTLDKKNIKASDTGRDIRIGNHVDALFTLNQTGQEKKEGVMRLGTAAHRWRDFNELDHVTVLQQLSLGQVILDSAK